MTKVPRTLVATLAARDLRPLAFQGVRAMDRWLQLAALLEAELGPDHAALFAEPLEHGRRDAVDWYAHAQGSVVAWQEADGATRARAEQELGRLARDLQAFIDKLRASNDPNQAMAAQILDLAMQYPGPDSLYLVGDRPVLVNWGSIPAGADAQGQSVLRYARVRASDAPIRMRASAAPAPLPVAEPDVGFPWSAFLLWFAAGCCVALLLVLALQLARPERQGNPALAADQAFLAARRDEAGLRRDLDRLRGQLAAAAADCAAGTDRAPASDLGSAELLRFASGAHPGDDLGFLDGCWQTREYARPQDGTAGAAVYCMDAAGMGFMQWTSGSAACQGLARARFLDDGSLRLAHGEIACSDGAILAAATVTCEAGNPAAACLLGGGDRVSEASGDAFALRRVEE